MSAYVVSRATIDAIVHVLLHGPLGAGRWEADRLGWRVDDETYVRASELSADEIGQLLWIENLTSVAYRYPNDSSGTRPSSWTDEEILGYTHTRPACVPTAVQVLRLIDGLEYQSCEHPNWDGSPASRALNTLRRSMIRFMPGYEDASSEWPEQAVA